MEILMKLFKISKEYNFGRKSLQFWLSAYSTASNSITKYNDSFRFDQISSSLALEVSLRSRSGKGDFGWKSERIVITIEGSDYVGVANRDHFEWLSAVDKHRLSFGVFSDLSLAAAGTRLDGKTGTAHICQDVVGWACIPTEIDIKANLGSPGKGVVIKTDDGAIRNCSIFRSLECNTWDADAESGDCECQAH